MWPRPYQALSCRGSPVRWQSRSRSVARWVATRSRRRKSGRYFRTGVSHSTLPSSTRIPSAVAVKALVMDPTEYTVSAVARAPRFTSARPKPSANTTRPSRTTATDSPGTCHWRITRPT